MLMTLLFCLAIQDPAPLPPGEKTAPSNPWEYLTEKYDADDNGIITREEYSRSDDAFGNLDRNGDGTLSLEDWSSFGRPSRGRRSARPGSRDSSQLSRRARVPALQVGQVAPDFKLPILVHAAKQTGKKKIGKEPRPSIRLSSFANKKPVALIFGSYT